MTQTSEHWKCHWHIFYSFSLVCVAHGLSSNWSNPFLLLQLKPKASFMSLQGNLWLLDTRVTSQMLPPAGVWPRACSRYRWFDIGLTRCLYWMSSEAQQEGEGRCPSSLWVTPLWGCLSQVHCTSHCGLLRQHIGHIWQTNQPCFLRRKC